MVPRMWYIPVSFFFSSDLSLLLPQLWEVHSRTGLNNNQKKPQKEQQKLPIFLPRKPKRGAQVTTKYQRDCGEGVIGESDPLDLFMNICAPCVFIDLTLTSACQMLRTELKERPLSRSQTDWYMGATNLKSLIDTEILSHRKLLKFWSEPSWADCLLKQKYQHSPQDLNKTQCLITQYSSIWGIIANVFSKLQLT